MIEASVLKLLQRSAPNYHIVSERFAKETFSLCTCGKCQNSISGRHYGTPEKEGRRCRNCKRVMDALHNAGRDAAGYSKVDEFGTCDAAKFIPEDYSRFKLEGGNQRQEDEELKKLCPREKCEGCDHANDYSCKFPECREARENGARAEEFAC